MAGYDQDLSRIVEELNRAAPGSRPADKPSSPRPPQNAGSLDQLLAFAVRQNASDLLLIAGTPVALRVNGTLAPAAGPPLSPDDVRNFVVPLLDSRQYEELQKKKSVDFCFVRDPVGRFRANIHHQRGTLAASIRLLPARIPTIESLHLPAALTRIADRRQGLVLVTGATGSGKSSTLAALIDLINTRRRTHIVTIEDPVEYQHTNRSSIVEQIEVGHDTPDFVNSLRSILRQTPDVILVGEMRDAETMATVLTAAETGHLVFSTLHTNDAIQSVSRILDSFPAAQPAADAPAIVAGAAGGDRAATGAGSGRRDALSGARDHDRHRRGTRPDPQRRRPPTSLASSPSGRAEGMMTMEQSLADLVRAGRITRETAFAHCFRPEELRRVLEG